MKDSSSSLSRKKKPKIKIVCSFNGAFLRRPPSGKLRYTGGETRIISVDRTITFSRLNSKVLELIRCPKRTFSLYFQISSTEIAEEQYHLALIDSDDDVRCMIDAFEKLEFRGKYHRLWIFVCNDNDDVYEYVNLEKLENVVFDACGKVKFSDDCLRKNVLKQQLVAKQSDFVRSFCLGLGNEENEMVIGRFDNKNCGDFGVSMSDKIEGSLSCDFENPRFVGSSYGSNMVDYKYSDDNCMESRSYVDSVSVSLKDTVDYKYDDDDCMEKRSDVDSVSLSPSRSRTLNPKDTVDYKYDDDDDDSMESRSDVDSVLLSASHCRPLNPKDGNSGVRIDGSNPAFVNAGRISTLNSSYPVGDLLFPRPHSIMSYYDAKCDSRNVVPATLSNLNRENIMPCSVGSMTLRPGLAPLSCSNQLLGGLSTATSSYSSSDSGICNYHYGSGVARKQKIYPSHSRSNRSNITVIGNHWKVGLDGRPWMGKFYPGIQSSSVISKQGQVVKPSSPTLLKPWSDFRNQHVEGDARASQCILNNLTCSFTFPSGSEENISEHTNPKCHFSYHDPLPGVADQSFSLLAATEKLPGFTEVNTHIDFLNNCVPKQHSVTNQQDVANISRSPNKTELGCNAKLLEMGAVCESFSKNQSGALITEESISFSSHNLSLLSLDDLKSPTHPVRSYISDTSVKPQSMALHLMGQKHFGAGPQAQISNEAVSTFSSDKAMELHEENKQEAVLQQYVESVLNIEDKEEIKKTCDESKANGEIPPEIATVYNHLASGELQTIKNSDLEYIKELGSGTYGTVFYGKWKGSDVAIKKLKPGCFYGGAVEENRLIADFWNEAHILGQLRHPNIVALYGVVTDGPANNLATVTEFMINGSLKQVFRRKDRTIDRRKRLILAMDTAFGMEYLHEKNIVHFDLKSHNLLVNMRDPQRPVCKIGDLGLSKIKQKTLVSGGVRGTIPWMAPELLNCKSLVTEKVDVYSFGIVMWELLTGEEPYSSMRSHEIIAGIIKGTLRPETPAWCDPAWRSLMEKCWSADPNRRPAFSEIAKELRTMAAAMNIK